MELEEAIEILKEDLEHTKRANECGLATRGEFNKEIEAIETVLEELRKYREGEIISIKVLEDYYLVSKDKEKQMTLANKELFKEYVPKKIVDKQENMIDEIKSKLEEHIQHCKQEAKGNIHNEICHISLKFDERLLNIIENKAEESE